MLKVKEWFYERSGPAAKEIFDKRISGDYDDFVEHTPEDALALIPPAKAFINKAKELLDE